MNAPPRRHDAAGRVEENFSTCTVEKSDCRLNISAYSALLLYHNHIAIRSMLKSKLEFYAKITTPDGREITRRVEEEIPDELNPHDLDEFMSSFDDYERRALRARNGICKEITQAWLDEQAKKGA
jgi:hypothetical protein